MKISEHILIEKSSSPQVYRDIIDYFESIYLKFVQFVEYNTLCVDKTEPIFLLNVTVDRWLNRVLRICVFFSLVNISIVYS